MGKGRGRAVLGMWPISGRLHLWDGFPLCPARDGLAYLSARKLSLFLGFVGKYNVQSKLRQWKEAGRQAGTPGCPKEGRVVQEKESSLPQLPGTGMWVHLGL